MRPGRKEDIVVVGNGCAAAECIIALRQSGHDGKIRLVTNNKWPVANPMLTTYYVAGKIGFDKLFPYDANGGFYQKYDVNVIAGSPVVALDAEKKLVTCESGLALNYDKCLVSTGAAPLVPPVEGMNSDKVYTLRTVDDAIRLREALAAKPEKALVVGASMVGIKLVELFYEAGVEVCLADLAQHIFPLAAHNDCAQAIEKRLSQKGIELRFGASVEKVEETTRTVKVHFKDTSETEVADLLVMCTGVRANVDFIDRKQVAADKGILVDDHMRTNVSGLYAAGDVAQGMDLSQRGQIIGLWAKSRYQGRTAGRNMAGGDESFREDIPCVITHFMGMDFVSIGDVNDRDSIQQKYDGKSFRQLFWKGGLLVGANLLDSYAESGVIKSALIRGQRQSEPSVFGSLPAIQNLLLQNIRMEVQNS